ncbi:MAG: BREX-2 system adenine-specific DNA-methyltransferase PglX [Acidimicrobiales bacterium]
MINSQLLLDTLKGQLGELLEDLHRQVETVPEIHEALRGEYQKAFDAERTGWTFTEWSDDRLTQVAVGWLLACVFVRYGEDNRLIDDAMIGGTGEAAVLARAAQQDYFRANPTDSDREYLHHVFHKAAALPGLDGVLGEGRSPLWLTNPSGDACTELLALFRRTDDAGDLKLDFTDPVGDTRFLGDLYQDLSEHAKKTYALLQTPDFVEEFILDRTLDSAIESVGLAQVSIIDPTCGSGHFLLGAFERLWQRWTDAEPAMPADQRAAKALDAVWGVDINPFAAAIARFRLLVAAMQRADQRRLADVRNYPIHVAVGDSLLWGAPKQSFTGMEGLDNDDHQFLYATEDSDALRETFERRYSAVVGNPPYIVPKDKAANAAYRAKYGSCHRQYSLGVPFTELFFELAEPGKSSTGRRAGFVGMITANSFMKREFGKKLITKYIPKWDLTHMVDTSGAHIPGHGTPTVILFGRNQRPVADTIRAVQGIRGEPSTPADPTKGLVWTAITNQIDEPGSESDYISVANTDRVRFATHPWSIGGGGAAELKDRIDSSTVGRLSDFAPSIGSAVYTRLDDGFVANTGTLKRYGLSPTKIRPLVEGDEVRDFFASSGQEILFPYSQDLEAESEPDLKRRLWPLYRNLVERKELGGSQLEIGLEWYEFNRFLRDRYRTSLSLVFSNVATHNHFALNRGNVVYNAHAPMLVLRSSEAEDDHFGLLGLLNSSVACFWMKQVFQGKHKGDGGEAHADPAGQRFEFDGTKLQQFPLPGAARPIEAGRRLDGLAQALAEHQPSATAAAATPTRDRLDTAHAESERIVAEMTSAQEELDWQCLHLYGLTDTPLTVPEGRSAPPLALGERAFEIALARKVAAGNAETAWFTRHRSTPITELPARWPDWYQDLVNRRIELIESDRNVGLVERPEHKRRWNRAPWEDMEQAALRDWLLDRLEDRSLWFDGDYAVTRTVAQLADRVSTDEDWMSVARVYTGQVDVDALAVITALVADEHVPAQAAARYKPSGRKKRAEWERTWDLQRAEDRGDYVGRIAVPPKYAQADFARPSYWKQRGKLDVPKERFTSVTAAERDASSGDSTMVLAWAGFDHAQLAQALATLLHQRQTVDGWTGDQLIPLAAALHEVLPWVEQWHPDIAPGLGQPLAAFYRGQLDQVLASIGATTDTIAAWEPPAPTRGRKTTTTTKAEA